MNKMTGSSWSHDPNASLSSESQLHIPVPLSAFNNSGKNIFCLLARREISPRTRQTTKRHWADAFTLKSESLPGSDKEAEYDAKHSLLSWVEAESLRHLTPIYCPLMPPPRSTIAAAFSPDGRTLASTHGDHTVKIIHCETGNCLKVLSGHRRTPWVVRFHPLCPEILASGSLDHEVRLWDANTSDCLGSRDFYRPIASIAFHAKGELLAVASGHKLYMWHYSNKGEGSSPAMILKTKRSLRAVHFHPHGAPFLLTAEVNDLGTSDSSLMQATSPGYLQYPPPAVFLPNIHSIEGHYMDPEISFTSSPRLFLPSFPNGDSSVDSQQDNRHLGQSSAPLHSSQLQLHPWQNPGEQNDDMLFPMDTSPPVLSESYHGTEPDIIDYFPDGMHCNGMDSVIREPTLDVVVEGAEWQPEDANLLRRFSELDSLIRAENALFVASGGLSLSLDPVASVYLNNTVPSNRYRTSLEMPSQQGWLMGESQSRTHDNSSRNFELNPATWTPDQSSQGPTDSLELSANITQAPADSLVVPLRNNISIVSGSTSVRKRIPPLHVASLSDSRDDTGFHTGSHVVDDTPPPIVPSELVTPVTAEVPCTVKLRLWPYDVRDPCAPLNADRCRLTIPHAVLCSEMGAHFSPCGRYLAVCVACALPHTEADPVLPIHLQYEATVAATSPTRHPVSAHQLIYELRIYSLEEATFGFVLISRAIRAAHCLTSIQFSPTSEHLLLAYGRRHSSLLKSVVVDGEKTIPVYTILEVYRVSDMELVRVLSSAVDEVNVACFHPLPGGGLVYGTKEGRLRIFHYDGPLGMDLTGTNSIIKENVFEEGRLRVFHYDGPLGMGLNGTNSVIEENMVELLEHASNRWI